MSWLLLLGAIALDVVFAFALSASEGLRRLGPSTLALLSLGLSVVLFARALRDLEVGVAYAVFGALGTAVIAVIGVVWYGESASPLKIVALGLICTGVALLPLAR